MIITLNKLKRFYDKCKLIWDSLDDRLEETEAEVASTSNDVSILSNRLKGYKIQEESISDNCFGFTLVGSSSSSSKLIRSYIVVKYAGQSGELNHIMIPVTVYCGQPLINYFTSFGNESFEIWYKTDVETKSTYYYIRLYTSNWGRFTVETYLIDFTVTGPYNTVLDTTDESVISMNKKLDPVDTNQNKRLDEIKSLTGLTNLFPQLMLVNKDRNGTSTQNRVTSYGDKSFYVKENDIIVFEVNNDNYAFYLWMFDDNFVALLNGWTSNDGWVATNKNYIITIPCDGYLGIAFRKSDSSAITISEVQALDITLKYAYNNTELTKAQKSNDILLVENAKKNCIIPPHEPGYTETTSGVTFTVNDDYSISVSGTASIDTSYKLMQGSKVYELVKNNDMILSGCTGGNDVSGYTLEYSNDVDASIYCNNGDAKITAYPANYWNQRINILVRNGATVNTTIYPMIRPAGTSPDYVPYMMSNMELTEYVQDIYVEPDGNLTDPIIGAYKIGNKIYVEGYGQCPFGWLTNYTLFDLYTDNKSALGGALKAYWVDSNGAHYGPTRLTIVNYGNGQIRIRPSEDIVATSKVYINGVIILN